MYCRCLLVEIVVEVGGGAVSCCGESRRRVCESGETFLSDRSRVNEKAKSKGLRKKSEAYLPHLSILLSPSISHNFVCFFVRDSLSFSKGPGFIVHSTPLDTVQTYSEQ